MREEQRSERGVAQQERDSVAREVWRDERGGGMTRVGGMTR
jgi:hypothetical protein